MVTKGDLVGLYILQPVCDSQSRGWQGGGAEYLPRGDSMPAYNNLGLESIARQPMESGMTTFLAPG